MVLDEIIGPDEGRDEGDGSAAGAGTASSQAAPDGTGTGTGGTGRTATLVRLKTMLVTLAATVGLAAIIPLWVIATGGYDVAASAEHGPVTAWALETLKERSIAARAGELPVPLPTDSAALAHGLEHFHAMCVECHGAPGYDRGEAGQGLNPRPPRLEEDASEWSDAELFWITKHGIRLAGMPGFGTTHSDEELAAIVAFVRAMATMTEEEYVARVQALPEDGGHTHAPGTPAHEH